MQRDAHRRRHLRCIGALEFHADAPAVLQHQQVEFGAGMGGPEVRLIRPRDAQDLVECEALPRGAGLRVPRQRRRVADAEQLVQQAGVAQVDLRRLHLALAEVREPGLKLAHQIRLRQPVEVAAHGAFVHAERTRRRRRVPHLAVIVRQHRPEAVQRRRGDVHAKLRQVALDGGADELAPPDAARLVVVRHVRAREATAPPQRRSLRGADANVCAGACAGLVEREPARLDDLDAPGQRLARLAQQRRRRAAQQQKAGRVVGAVDQHAQHLEQIGRVLHLVDDDQAAQVFQRDQRRAELRFDLRVFEVEPVRRAAAQQGARERRLADLARPDERHRRAACERGADGAFQASALEHARMYLENPASCTGFSK